MVLSLSSCDFFKPASPGNPVARVNENFLYKEDLVGVVPEGVSKDDSLVLVNNYINKWALQLLLLSGAERNLPDKTQQEFNKLVVQYKSDLYTKAYLDALVKQNINDNTNPEELKEVYESNKESFKLNEELLKLRYIKIAQNANDAKDITNKFKSFTSEDKRHLDSISVQFKSYSLNDSIWIRYSQLIEKVPITGSLNKNQLLKKTNFIQLTDSLDLYLVHVNEVLFPNDYAPLEYVLPTVNQIVVNRRKLELIKQLEKDIIQDANSNKKFEIYNNQ
ncbi:peptidyl-prolyl cis-trans isomerase [Paucihalobacter ruber]|uniref:Peptidyl-prolyl cis-trans isomerase n=1 Tax=Paucihalobacter ruber TaxID=2567861 RepID=A0A506PPW4_9FLAO|nr:peptidyl-prolyl cis-trans isomerase [Paucihalobacter ruber]